MQFGYINKLQFSNNPFKTQSLAANPMNPFAGGAPSGGLGHANKVSFQNVLSNTVNQVNQMAMQPDQMLTEAVTNGTYDIHDVMMASAKAELAVSIAAQVTTKVVQAYDRILQIQV